MSKPFDFSASPDGLISGEPVSPETRRLIDEAIAAGRVTVCPPQTYSEDVTGSSWKGAPAHNNLAAKLGAKRRQTVANLAREGMCAARIARVVGISQRQVRRITDGLRIKCRDGRAGQGEAG